MGGSLLGEIMCDRMPDKRPGVSRRRSQRERSGRRKSVSRGTPQKAELEVPAPSSMRGPGRGQMSAGGRNVRQSESLMGSASKERKGCMQDAMAEARG